MGRSDLSLRKRVVFAAFGILVGAGLGAIGAMLLFWVGFAPTQARPRLVTVMPTLLVWLGIFGGLVGGFGRDMLRACERVLLPDKLDDSARRLYRLAIAFVGLAVTQYHVAAFMLDDPTDLPSFLLAARAMSNGLDFYDPEVIASFNDGSVGNRVFFPYLYLPLCCRIIFACVSTCWDWRRRRRRFAFFLLMMWLVLARP